MVVENGLILLVWAAIWYVRYSREPISALMTLISSHFVPMLNVGGSRQSPPTNHVVTIVFASREKFLWIRLMTTDQQLALSAKVLPKHKGS